MGSVLLRVVLGASFAAAILGGPMSAGAQPAPANSQVQATAKKLVDDARAAFDAADYDKAIELYREAYALIPHPELMFNMAQSHRLAGRADKAVQLYERYLELAPSGREAGSARAHLATLKAAGASRPAGTTTPEPTKPVPAKTEPAKTEPAKTEPAKTEPVKTEPPEDRVTPVLRQPDPAENRVDATARPGGSMRTAGIALGGLGLVSIGVGIYFTTMVLAAEDEAADILQMGGTLDDVKQRGEAAQRNGDIAYVLGGALVVGGAVAYYLGYRKDRAVPTTAFTPIVRPDFAGIALGGSWR